MSATPAEPTAPVEPTLATPEQLRLYHRGLFRYHDGFRDRLADIIEVQFRIQDAIPGGDMNLLEDLIAAAAPRPQPVKAGTEDGEPAPSSLPVKPLPTPLEAMVRLGRLVAVGFDLPPIDETTAQGLSVQERCNLLADFLAMAPADDQGDAGDGSPEASGAVADQPVKDSVPV